MFSASGKANFFAQSFSKNSDLDDSDISLAFFPSRTNPKLHNISVTTKMVEKVVMKLDSSKVSGPDYISVAVLKIFEPEISYILAELFSKFLKESCCPECWKVSSVILYLRLFEKGLQLKSYRSVSLLSVVTKVFEKLVNNRIFDHPGNCGLFSYFQLILGLLDQLQIFRQLYLIELLGLLTGLG